MVNGRQQVRPSQNRREKRSSFNNVDRIRINKKSGEPSKEEGDLPPAPNRGSRWKQRFYSQADLLETADRKGKFTEGERNSPSTRHQQTGRRHQELRPSLSLDLNNNGGYWFEDNCISNYNEDREYHDYDDLYHNHHLKFNDDLCSLRRTRSLAAIREENFKDSKSNSRCSNRRSQLIPRAKLVNHSFFHERYHKRHNSQEDFPIAKENGNDSLFNKKRKRNSDDYYRNLKNLEPNRGDDKQFSKSWHNITFDRSDLESLNSEYFKNSSHQNVKEKSQVQDISKKETGTQKPRQYQQQKRGNFSKSKSLNSISAGSGKFADQDLSQSSVFPETTPTNSDITENTSSSSSSDSGGSNSKDNRGKGENIGGKLENFKSISVENSIQESSKDFSKIRPFISYDCIYLSSEESSEEKNHSEEGKSESVHDSVTSSPVHDEKNDVQHLTRTTETKEDYDEQHLYSTITLGSEKKGLEAVETINENLLLFPSTLNIVEQSTGKLIAAKSSTEISEKRLKTLSDYATTPRRGILEHLTYISTSRTAHLHLRNSAHREFIDNKYYSLPDINISRSLKVSEHIDAKLRSIYESHHRHYHQLKQTTTTGRRRKSQNQTIIDATDYIPIYDSINRFGKAHKKVRQREINALLSTTTKTTTTAIEKDNSKEENTTVVLKREEQTKTIEEISEERKHQELISTKNQQNREIQNKNNLPSNEENTFSPEKTIQNNSTKEEVSDKIPVINEDNQKEQQTRQSINNPLLPLPLPETDSYLHLLSSSSSSTFRTTDFRINQTRNHFPGQFQIIVTADVPDKIIQEDLERATLQSSSPEGSKTEESVLEEADANLSEIEISETLTESKYEKITGREENLNNSIVLSETNKEGSRKKEIRKTVKNNNNDNNNCLATKAVKNSVRIVDFHSKDKFVAFRTEVLDFNSLKATTTTTPSGRKSNKDSNKFVRFSSNDENLLNENKDKDCNSDEIDKTILISDVFQIFRAHPLRVYSNEEDYSSAHREEDNLINVKMSRPQILHVIDSSKKINSDLVNTQQNSNGGGNNNRGNSIRRKHDDNSKDDDFSRKIEAEFQHKVDSVRCYWSKLMQNSNSTNECENEKNGANDNIIKDERNFVTSLEDDEQNQREEQSRTNNDISSAFLPAAILDGKDEIDGNKCKLSQQEKQYRPLESANDLQSFAPSVEIVEFEGEGDSQQQKKAAIVKISASENTEFDHVRYKVVKSNLFQKNIFTRSKKEAQFDGLLQYLQEYRFQELLNNNNIVIIEPVRTKIEKPPSSRQGKSLSGCKITGGSCGNMTVDNNNRTTSSNINSDNNNNNNSEYVAVPMTTAASLSSTISSSTSSNMSSLKSTSARKPTTTKRHFFYHPVRVNRELLEDELPSPDTVRNVRKFFEENVLQRQPPSSKVLFNGGGYPSPRSDHPYNLLNGGHHKRRGGFRYLTIDTSYGELRKWDSASLSSGVSSGDLSSPCDYNSHENASQQVSQNEAEIMMMRRSISDKKNPQQIFSSEENLCEDVDGGDDDQDEDDVDDNACNQSYYVSEDILEKIRECGSTITYYGGHVLQNKSPELNPTTKAIIREIQDGKVTKTCNVCQPNHCPHEEEIQERFSSDKGIKFKLIKSNSCSSRLELAGTGEDTVSNQLHKKKSHKVNISSYRNRNNSTPEPEESVRELVNRLESGVFNSNPVPRIIESQCIEKIHRNNEDNSEKSSLSSTNPPLVTINNQLIGTAKKDRGNPFEMIDLIKQVTVNNHISLCQQQQITAAAANAKNQNFPDETDDNSIDSHGKTNLNSKQKICRNLNVDLALNATATPNASAKNHPNNGTRIVAEQKDNMSITTRNDIQQYKSDGTQFPSSDNRKEEQRHLREKNDLKNESMNAADTIQNNGQYDNKLTISNGDCLKEKSLKKANIMKTTSPPIIDTNKDDEHGNEAIFQLQSKCNEINNMVSEAKQIPFSSKESNDCNKEGVVSRQTSSLSSSNSKPLVEKLNTITVDKSFVKHYVTNDRKLIEKRKYDDIEFEEFEVYDPSRVTIPPAAPSSSSSSSSQNGIEDSSQNNKDSNNNNFNKKILDNSRDFEKEYHHDDLVDKL